MVGRQQDICENGGDDRGGGKKRGRAIKERTEHTAFLTVLHPRQTIPLIMAQRQTKLNCQRARPTRKRMKVRQRARRYTIEIAAQEILFLRLQAAAAVLIEIEAVRATARLSRVAQASHVAQGVAVWGRAASVAEGIIAVCASVQAG